MLLNFSNHPLQYWSAEQLKTAKELYHEVVDLKFPAINPDWSCNEVRVLAQQYVDKIVQLKPDAVHIMGEHNFTFNCINLLKKINIVCIASTSKRVAIYDGNQKSTVFNFIQFREY